jgi:hypothetical protein
LVLSPQLVEVADLRKLRQAEMVVLVVVRVVLVAHLIMEMVLQVKEILVALDFPEALELLLAVAVAAQGQED